jgi:hypothetical protein
MQGRERFPAVPPWFLLKADTHSSTAGKPAYTCAVVNGWRARLPYSLPAAFRSRLRRDFPLNGLVWLSPVPDSLSAQDERTRLHQSLFGVRFWALCHMRTDGSMTEDFDAVLAVLVLKLDPLKLHQKIMYPIPQGTQPSLLGFPLPLQLLYHQLAVPPDHQSGPCR